ncbi:LPXTG cell wall anchor domain-containing protein [Lactobacillus gasseri]|uniref:mucin-binding protein n=1 Tax=Lactobacillus gasseri TaxID=1596 RepID=UPI001E591A22|nr:Rib/alpha-like domain-containing protein [Lactobacillus gasseri]UFN99159.1 LPXTG cell wall anchor domain-containing protein [Lactobacillus gasseri]
MLILNVITYAPNDQTGKISYVDNKTGEEVDTTQLSGKTDEEVTINPVAPTGWKIVDGQNIPTTEKATSTGIPPVTVKVEHKTTVVPPTDPKTPKDKLPDNPDKHYPDGVGEKDLNKFIVRQITVVKPDGTREKHDQSVTLTRNATVDEVTGEVIKYGDWTTSNFGEYDAPTVPGYTPSQAKVEGVKVTADSDFAPVTITYTANRHTLNINYVDKDGNKIGNPYQVPGRTDETVAVDVPGHVPANWELVPNQKYTTSITFGSDDPQDQSYVIQHKTTTTDGRDHKDNQDLYREVTRTILMKVPNATSQGRETETLSFYRIETLDEVTGNYTYSDWASNVTGDKTAFDEFDVSKTNDGKEIAAGYTPTSNDVVLEDKNGDKFVPSQSALKNGVPADSFTVEVAYTPNAQKTTVTYVDKDGKEITNPDGSVIPGSHYDLTGVTDQSNVPTNIQNNVPTNWHITDPEVPATITFGADGHTPITVHVAHNTKTVDKDNVPDGYAKDDFAKDISRSITAKEPSGDVDLSQKTELTRTGTYDEVTKKVVSYSDWTTDKFAEVSAPNVPGYTPSQAKVDGADVTVDSKFDPTVITYAPNAQKTTVTYVDKNGKEITNPDGSAITGSHYDVDGVTGQKDIPTNIEKNVPTNWHITDKTIPGTISFGPNGHDPIKVHVAHNTKPADKDNVPDGYKREDFDKTVTRTITAKEPSGDVDLSQHVELTRTGTYDEVTKEVTYNPWTTSSFVEVTAPEVAGYTPSKASVEAVDKVTSDYVDPKVVINYVPNDQKGKISYVDDKTNIEVGTTSLTGKTDEDVVINPVAPAGWKIVDGQNIPKTEKATPNGIDTVIVKVEHKTTTVPPTDPKTPEDKLPDNPDKHYPDGVSEKDLNKTIVRQITVVRPDGTRESHDQSVKLTRSATVDEVTGTVTGYSNWTTGNFDEYDAPVIAGYTPSQAKVDGVKVTADSNFDPVVITYVEDPIGQDITVKKGDTPSPEDGVKNHGDLDKVTDPKHPGTKTTYTWKKTPDTSVAGDVPATVIVHYPDGSNKPVDITVHVVDDTPVVPTKNPDPIGQNITVKKGDTPDPKPGVKNSGDLDKITDPKHPGTKTTYTWKKTPNTSVPGDVPATVIVHYPDGSNKPVDITVHVVDDTPVVPTKNPDPVGQDITVKKGDTPDPEDGVKNHGDLDKITDPKHPGTKTTYTWKKTPDTSVAGDVPATVIVHYPDGSNKPVDITVHVVDDTPVVPTKNPEPAGQDIHTPQGKVPTPESAITNKDKMPDGTKYTWKEIPDVNTLGKHPSVVVVTYPDGTAVEVKVNVFVDGTPEAKKETKAPVVKKQVVEPTKVETRQKLVNNYVAPRAVEVQRAQAKGKRQLPQTGAKENIASEVLGMLSVGLGALTAGFASKRRKKNR